MLHNTFEIEIDYNALGIEHKGDKATFTTYIKDMYPDVQNPFKRPLVIICPGGGYGHHSPREGEAIALKMLDLGYNAIVLRYSLIPNHYPCALYEAAYTVNYAREHAAEWDVDPNKIIMAGFSAGGHVAAGLSILWNEKELDEYLEKGLKVSHEAVKPNALLLGYPVITSGEFAHNGSFVNLLGDRYDELLDSMSLEKRVTEDMPNAFIWQTYSDASVPVENALLLANAMKEKDVRFELHIFPDGTHGLGLGTKETDTKDGMHYAPEVGVWPELFATWANNLLNK